MSLDKSTGLPALQDDFEIDLAKLRYAGTFPRDKSALLFRTEDNAPVMIQPDPKFANEETLLVNIAVPKITRNLRSNPIRLEYQFENLYFFHLSERKLAQAKAPEERAELFLAEIRHHLRREELAFLRGDLMEFKRHLQAVADIFQFSFLSVSAIRPEERAIIDAHWRLDDEQPAVLDLILMYFLPYGSMANLAREYVFIDQRSGIPIGKFRPQDLSAHDRLEAYKTLIDFGSRYAEAATKPDLGLRLVPMEEVRREIECAMEKR